MSNNTTNGGAGGPPGGPPCPLPMTAPDFGIYQEVANYLWLILPPFIIIIGVIGNTLTVIVLFRQIGKWTSTAVYLFVLALSDTVQLLNSPLRNWILRGLEKHDVRNLSELGCKFSLYFTYASVHFSSWILVAVTVERLISVMWPHRVRRGCTPWTSSVTLVILLIMIGALNAHFFYGHGVSDLPQFYGEGFCEVKYQDHVKFADKIWPWIDFVVAFALPFVVLLVCNAVIISKLRRTRIKRRRLSISSEKAYAKDTKVVTMTLVVLSVVFFVCLTPVQVYFIIRPYRQEEIDKLMCVDFDEFIRQIAIDRLVYSVVTIVSYINAAFNFILYVFSGNKFRQEFIGLLTCRKVGKDGVFGSISTGSSRRRSTLTSVTRTDSRSSIGNKIDISGINNVSFNPDISQTNNQKNNELKQEFEKGQLNEKNTSSIDDDAEYMPDKDGLIIVRM